MISVVTVSYKSLGHLANMLSSLFAHTHGVDLEVFVVINGDASDPSELEARFPSVRFLVSKKNLGFAGGNNLAIAEACGDFILLVNPDIVFTENAIQAIETHMRRDADVGIGGISLKNMDGSQQPCVWRFPTVTNQLLLLLKIPHLFPNVPPVRRYLMKEFDYAQTQDVDQVMGAFFCIRRETLTEIGPLDAAFFLWYEEVDLCKRAKDAFWKVRYYSDVSATHVRGASFGRVRTIEKQKIVRQSLRTYMRKHHGFGAWLLFTLLDPVFAVLAMIAAVLKPY